MKYLTNSFFITLLFIYACSGTDTPSEQSQKTIKNSVPATEVKVVRAEVKPFEYLISASGKIASSAETRTQFNRAGIVEKILVSNGMNVVRGQILGVLYSETQKLSLSKAKILLDEKKLAYDDQMVYANASDSAHTKKVRENIRILSGLASAEIAYEEAMLVYNNSFIRAEISGVVSGIETNVGSPVSQNDLFCFLHDPNNLLVKVEVLEVDAMQLSKGISADIHPMFNTVETYAAKVHEINPRVDEKTGLVKVTLKLEGSFKVFPGMNVQTVIRLPYNKSIVVPKEAVVIRSGKTVVFTANDGLAKWNYVTVGRENGKDIEVLEGLRSGDEIIVTNNLQLAHDATIAVKK